MASKRQITIPLQPPHPAGLNIAYVLWLAAMTGASLAAVTLVVNLSVYTFNGIATFFTWPLLFPGTDHGRLLLITGFFAIFGTMAQVARMRMDAMARSVISVSFPGELIARTLGDDPVSNKFECHARVRIEVYTPDLAEKIQTDRAGLREALERGLAIAITDPVTRFSKVKIEETLKLALGERLDLLDVAGVTLMKLRQERVVEELSPPADGKPAADAPVGPALALPST